MSPEWISAISGLVGAVIGGGCTIVAVRLAENRTKRSELLKLLIEQRVRLRTGKLRDLSALTADDHLGTLKAFIDLRSALFMPDERRAIDRVWRYYKGNGDVYIPIFHSQSVSYPTSHSVEVVSHHPTWKESCERVDAFISFLMHEEG
jgi:hypothetical protein